MIVKNESKIITRLFDSVVNFVDYYCISDTGSTDNTKEIIEAYWKKAGKPGKIVDTGSFTNFSHNRNIALHACQDFPADYVLLLDADMVLSIGKDFKKSSLTHDVYTILQGSDEFYYTNVRIVRNKPGYNYNGVTHEYLDKPGTSTMCDIPKASLFVKDVGDGGCKSDKFERDIKLLTQGIIDEPHNEERYRFYLANSYFDTGKHAEAIEQYIKRIDKKGWEQEIWYSWLRLGHCYKATNQIGKMIEAWLTGWELIPDRLENIFELVHYFRCNCRYKLAYHFYKLMRSKSLLDDKKKDGYLFLSNDVYMYKLNYEYCLFAYYNGIRDISDDVVRVLNNSTAGWMIDSALYNLKFYPVVMPHVTSLDISSKLNTGTIMFTSSSPCIVPDPNGDGYLANIRFVNYKITPTGAYDMGGVNSCCTMNELVRIDKDLKKSTLVHIIPLDINAELWCYYVGVEDIRLYNKAKNFIGVGFHKKASKIGIVYGRYPEPDKPEYLEVKEAKMSEEFAATGCEKNWVFYTDKEGNNKIVYSWSPLRLCTLNEDTGVLSLDETRSEGIPRIFARARGSTCGFTYNNEIWFVVHLVAYDNPRSYYHVISVFDLDMRAKRYSAPIKLTDKNIEYCLGIIVEKDRVILSYSGWDSSSVITAYDKTVVESYLKYSL